MSDLIITGQMTCLATSLKSIYSDFVRGVNILCLIDLFRKLKLIEMQMVELDNKNTVNLKKHKTHFLAK